MLLFSRKSCSNKKYLSQKAQDACDKFAKSLKKENFQDLPCLCGTYNDYLISEIDRYGFNLNFKLCKNCGLIRIDPYLDNESLEYFYSTPYRDIKHNEPADLFLRQKKFGKKIFEYLSQKDLLVPEMTVFEIGCASGGILSYFKDKGLDVYGSDFDDRFINYGKEQGLSLFNGDAFNYIKKINPKLIIINHVLEHIKDLHHFFNQLEQNISQDTIVYISVPGNLKYIQKNFPNNMLNYFLIAHPWSFDLNSFKFTLLSGKKFQVLYEDETIKIVIKKVNKQFVYSNKRFNKFKTMYIFSYYRIRKILVDLVKRILGKL